jgi:hypothetical protein
MTSSCDGSLSKGRAVEARRYVQLGNNPVRGLLSARHSFRNADLRRHNCRA